MSGAWFLGGHFQVSGWPVRGGMLLGSAAVHWGCRTGGGSLREQGGLGEGQCPLHTTGSTLMGAGLTDTPGMCPEEQDLLLSALWGTRLLGIENWKVRKGRKEWA